MITEYNAETFENVELADGTVTDCEFIECHFKKCNLTNLKLNRCSFMECRFTDCHISVAETKNTEVKSCEFYQTDLISVNWSLLVSGGLSDPINKMKDCILKYNNFMEMNFKKFYFSGNDILSSIFTDCCAAEANFSGCDLEKTEFLRCDLRKADFRRAKGYLVDVASSKLTAARFSMPEATSLLYSLRIKID